MPTTIAVTREDNRSGHAGRAVRVRHRGDPNRDTVDLAVVNAATGVVQCHRSDRADGPGYRQLLSWATEQAPGRRVWALEGTGSFAAGLATALAEAGEDVVELSLIHISEPTRPY